MTKEIVHLTSRYSTGCTFLDWSIHWLSGKTDVWTPNSNRPVPIIDNPIKNKIAHGHPKIHPHGLDNIKMVMGKINRVAYDDLISIYWVGNRTGHTETDITKFEYQVKKQAISANVECWAWLCEQGYKGIFMDFVGPKMYLDQLRTTQNPFGVFLENEIDAIRQWLELFKDNLDLTHTWDVREQYALILRPYETWEFSLPIDRSYDHYYFNNIDWWYHGQDHIKKIFDFLGKSIDLSRWNHWVTVYEEWAVIQRKIVDFANNVDNIVTDIVSGKDREIEKLSFRQEAIIQHLLIYKHGLNFRTWNLETLPTNTKDIHNLLEPNIHSAENIYGSSTEA
jgi:hypothetical protein